jgi:hypothetical protein
MVSPAPLAPARVRERIRIQSPSGGLGLAAVAQHLGFNAEGTHAGRPPQIEGEPAHRKAGCIGKPWRETGGLPA